MSITEIKPYYETYGQIRYFHADRFFNVKEFSHFNKDKIKAKEIVTYDCGLMELVELESEDEPALDQQVLAMIVRPEAEPAQIPGQDGFEFCGYDLSEMATAISAITNCGAMFSAAINYDSLNSFGLIRSYQEAVSAQTLLLEHYPDENHADCEIVEIWRRLVYRGGKIEIGIIEDIDSEYDYSAYEPEKYNCVYLNESYLDVWWNDLSIIKSYFHTLKRPSLSVARYGVTIFPPESLPMLEDIMLKDKRIHNDIELRLALDIIREAVDRNKHIILYGI